VRTLGGRRGRGVVHSDTAYSPLARAISGRRKSKTRKSTGKRRQQRVSRARPFPRLVLVATLPQA
jgi:hypothetical protein